MLTILAAAALQTCVIVVPTDQLPGHVSPAEALIHERAHCAGWPSDHPGSPDGQHVPAKWRNARLPKGMKIETLRVPSDVAGKICGGVAHISSAGIYGCQWME